MDERLQQFETKMEKTCEYLEADFMTIRAGRANPHVLDKIRVDYYGSPTPLQKVGNVTDPDCTLGKIPDQSNRKSNYGVRYRHHPI